MGYGERAGGIALEERFQDLDGLGLGCGAGGGDDGNLQIVGKPGRQALGISLAYVFCDGYKHLIAAFLRLRSLSGKGECGKRKC